MKAAAKEVKVTPAAEVEVAAADPKQALRERIEAEELAKYEEEQMRAEIRARLTGKDIDTSPGRPVDVAPAPAAPQPIIINVDNSNTNSNTAIATANVNVGVAVRQPRPFILRLLYFIFFGWWVGIIWVSIALLLCLSFFGLPIGLMMLRRAVEAFIL